MMADTNLTLDDVLSQLEAQGETSAVTLGRHSPQLPSRVGLFTPV